MRSAFNIKSVFAFIAVVLIVNCVQAQKIEIRLKADLFSFPVSNFTSDISNPKYEAAGHARTNEAAYVDFAWYPLKEFGMLIGYGFHSFNFETHFVIPRQSGQGNHRNEYRLMSGVGSGPKLGIIYKHNKIRTSVNYSMFEKLTSKQSHQSESYSLTIFDVGVPNPILAVGVSEDYIIGEFDISYPLWQFNIEYNIVSGLFLQAGFETKLRKPQYAYRLQLIDFLNDGPPEGLLVNDFRLNSQYSAYTIGLSYSIPIKKNNHYEHKE